MAFEYIPANTFIHKIDPRIKLFYWAVTITLTLFLGTDPIFLGILFISELIVLNLARVPFKEVISFLKSTISIVIFYTIINVLYPPNANTFVNPTTLFYLYNLPIMFESIIYAIGSTIRFLIMLLAIRTVLMITPIRDLILSLVKFKLPPEFGLALSIGFAYVPVLTAENRKIKEAQQARGLSYDTKNPIKKFDVLIRRMFIPSIFNSTRRTSDIAIAIESKGFSHDIANRTYMKELKMNKMDYFIVLVLSAFLVSGFIIGPFGLKIADTNRTIQIIKKILSAYF